MSGVVRMERRALEWSGVVRVNTRLVPQHWAADVASPATNVSLVAVSFQPSLNLPFLYL